MATRAVSKWGGAMIRLFGLSPCYTKHTSLTVWYVVCYQSAVSQLLGIQTTAVVMFTTESL